MIKYLVYFSDRDRSQNHVAKLSRIWDSHPLNLRSHRISRRIHPAARLKIRKLLSVSAFQIHG